jgi:glucan phosphoethanolaminetransferase (alkaline phosphatase superfamily)
MGTTNIATSMQRIPIRSFIAIFICRVMDLIILAIPVGVVIFHTLQVTGFTPRSRVAMAVDFVINHSMSFYIVLLWTLLGILLIYREAFRKQNKRIGIIIPVLIAIVLLLSIIEKASGQIGSDSIEEVTRTQWSQVLNYSLQFIQTSNLSMKHIVVACVPFLFLLTILFLVKVGIYRPNATIAITSSIFTLSVFIYCLYFDTSQFIKTRSSFSTYQRNLQEGERRELSHFAQESSAPMVFVYIGESTNRDMLYRELNARIKDSGYGNNAVLFSDVVSPHSHTFLSLVRALSVSGDLARDQLTEDRELSRINLISVLNRNDFTTSWISNQPGNDWVALLFGHEADYTYYQNKDAYNDLDSSRRKDSDVLPLALDRLKMDQPERSVVFFHSYAGHGEYCDNIPTSAVSRMPDQITSLPFSAVFGDVPVLNNKGLLRDINCYRNALSYVADNIDKVMRQMQLINRPAVLIYFSDHGEDVLDGTGHDSSRPSFRKIEIPFVVFFNDAAKGAYESKLNAAFANKDKRYGTTWLSDSIIDIAGISYDKRRILSIFRPLDAVPDRFSSLRFYQGRQYAIAVDGEGSRRDGINTTKIELYEKEQLIRSMPVEQQGRICAHRADSLIKFSDASRAFLCSEVDLVIDPQQQEVYVYHPPMKNAGLTLETLLSLQPAHSTGIWLDVKNAHGPTLEYLLEYLNQRIPQDKRRSTLIEVSLGETESNSLRDILLKIRRDGYGLSYYLPTDMGVKCSDHPQKDGCSELKKSTEDILQGAPYSSLSFDIRAKKFATSIDRPAGVELNTWDLAVKTKQDIDHDMLQRVSKYLIPYESPFNN